MVVDQYWRQNNDLKFYTEIFIFKNIAMQCKHTNEIFFISNLEADLLEVPVSLRSLSLHQQISTEWRSASTRWAIRYPSVK